MRKHYSLLAVAACLFLTSHLRAQSVGIGTSTPNASAQLDITSTSQGLLIPRMPTGSISTISKPAKALMIYDSSLNQLMVNMGTPDTPNWQTIVANSGWSLNGNQSTGYLGTWSSSPVYFEAGGWPQGFISTNNIALGQQAMYSASAASNDIGMGLHAMMYCEGNYSIGLGLQALMYDGGDNNIGIGTNAGMIDNGSDNIAIGGSALPEDFGGIGNTAVGNQALEFTSNASYNTAVGYNSGYQHNNGYNNVFLGANNDVNGDQYYNVIAIGQGVICTASDEARFGNSATNSIGGYADWTNFSDGRYKKNMRENVKGLDFIMRLRPITYNLDVTGIRNHLGQKAPADMGSQQSIVKREQEVLSGFSAQEVESAAAASGYNFSGIDKPKNDKDFYGLRYGDFVVPLVKGMQEQQKMIADLEKKVTALEEQNKLLIQLINNKK